MALIRNTPADDSTCGWFHLSPPRVARPRHSGVSATRWAVVGAGFTGLAAARQLALNFPDDEIVLIEAQEVGYGASGRNAGFAIDLPHDIGAEDYIGDIATAKISMELNLAGQSMLRALVEQHGIPADRILIEPHARHTTTNLRNCARLLLAVGFPADRPALIVSDHKTIRYIASRELAERNLREMGVQPGIVAPGPDQFSLMFTPSSNAFHVEATDPLDP